MMKMLKALSDSMKKFFKHLFLFIVFGFLYCLIEILFRGYTHPAMFCVGGLCGILIGLLNEVIEWDTPLLYQMLIGGGIVTLVELAAGCILNLQLKLNIWDYSDIPGNILGQICLPFSIAWCFLSLIAIILDDYLRYWFFGEEKPHYTWL